jgi:hypothetical protein
MTSQDRVLVLALPPLAPPVVVAPPAPVVVVLPPLVVPPVLVPPLVAAPPLVALPPELPVLLFPPVVEPSRVEPPVPESPPALSELRLPPVAPPELDTVPVPPELLLAPPLVAVPLAVLVAPVPPEPGGRVVFDCGAHPAAITVVKNIITPSFNQALEVGDCIGGLRFSSSQAAPRTS